MQVFRKDKAPEPWPFQAAKASWMAPGIGALVGGCLTNTSRQNPESADLIGLMVLVLLFVLCLLGFALGIASLTQMKQHGRRGILIPAGLGVLLDTFLLFVLTVGLLVRLGLIDSVF